MRVLTIRGQDVLKWSDQRRPYLCGMTTTMLAAGHLLFPIIHVIEVRPFGQGRLQEKMSAPAPNFLGLRSYKILLNRHECLIATSITEVLFLPVLCRRSASIFAVSGERRILTGTRRSHSGIVLRPAPCRVPPRLHFVIRQSIGQDYECCNT
jgi:hypothetical protein